MRILRDNYVSQQRSTQSYDDDECLEVGTNRGADSFKGLVYWIL